MALTERSRHKLYETCSVLVEDEQAVEEMFSYFPARDVEEPVTKDFLRVEIAAVRSDLLAEIAAVDVKVTELGADMRAEFAAIRSEMHQMMRTTQNWFIGTGISVAGLVLAITRFG